MLAAAHTFSSTLPGAQNALPQTSSVWEALCWPQTPESPNGGRDAEWGRGLADAERGLPRWLWGPNNVPYQESGRASWTEVTTELSQKHKLPKVGSERRGTQI